MLIVDRELLGGFLRAFGTILALTSLVLLLDTVIDWFEEMSQMGAEGYALGAQLYFASLPHDLGTTFPMAAGASVLWVVIAKARSRELLAWLAGGLSPARLAVPLAVGGLLVSAVAFLSGEFVEPASEQAAWRAERLLSGRTEASLSRNRNIHQAGAPGRYYMVEEFNAARMSMAEPIIIEVDQESGFPRWKLRATEAVLSPEGEWVFRRGVIQAWDANGALTESRRFGQVVESELDRPLDASFLNFLEILPIMQRLSFSEAWNTIQLNRADGRQTRELSSELHARLGLAIGVAVLVLLVCAHMIRPTEQAALVGFSGGLGLMVLYYLVFFGLKGVAENMAVLAPGAGPWATNGAFALLGCALLWRSSRGAWVAAPRQLPARLVLDPPGADDAPGRA